MSMQTDQTPTTPLAQEADPGQSEATGTGPSGSAPPSGTGEQAAVSSPQPRWRQLLKLNRKRLLIIGAAVLGVLLIAGIFLYLNFSAEIGALLTANDFCNAVKQQDYPKAYTYFSPGLQQQVSRDAFITISTKGDALQGKVTNCGVDGVNVALGGQSVVIHSTITRSKIGKQHNDLDLSLIDGKWKISSSPDPLLLPLTTAYYFCKDAIAQQYAAAYVYFSPGLQQQVSRDAFVTISLGDDNLNGRVTDCNVSSVTLSPDHKAVSVQSTLVRTKVTQPSQLHLALISANWKIDQSPDPLLLPLATAYDFCQDLKTQNYPGAYGFFAPALQQQIPQDAFETISQGADTLKGKITACNVSGVDSSNNGQSVVVHSTLVRSIIGNQPGDLHLQLIDNHWKIVQSPDPLIVPLTAAFEFCKDLKAQNYTAAYGYLAPSVQQQIPEDAFVTISQGGDTLQGKVTACNVSGVDMSANGQTVLVHSTLVRSIIGSQPGDLHLALLGGAWKISQSPDPLLLPLTSAFEFCKDLKVQNYVAAYGFFAGNVRQEIPQDAFVTISQGGDALQGKVTACNVTGVSMSSNGAAVTVQSTLVRTKQSTPGTVHLSLLGGVWLIDQPPDPLLLPLTSAFEFCQDLKAQNYAAAYSFLAPSLQSQVTEPAFLFILPTADRLQGHVTACNVTGVSSSGGAVTVQSTVVRSIIGGQPSTVHLVQIGGLWRIDRSPDPLLLPAATGYYFCQDLKARNYNGAYQLMSSSAQRKLGSPTTLALLLGTSTVLTGNVTACQVTSVAFNNAQSVTFHSTLSFQHFPNTPSQVNEVLEGSQWKVDRLTIFIAGLPVNIPAT
jgi:hypothetical protein